MAGKWLASGWRAAGKRVRSWHAACEQRLASGWRAAGANKRLASGLQACERLPCERLASGWRVGGEWLASGWRAAGERLASGWQWLLARAGERFASGLPEACERLPCERLASGWRAAGERLASGWQVAGERLASGLRAACERPASGWQTNSCNRLSSLKRVGCRAPVRHPPDSASADGADMATSRAAAAARAENLRLGHPGHEISGSHKPEIDTASEPRPTNSTTLSRLRAFTRAEFR